MAFSGLAAAAWRGSLSQRANAFATEERSACHRVLLASKRVSWAVWERKIRSFSMFFHVLGLERVSHARSLRAGARCMGAL